jgi:RimK family alpha-L-glutamate ligase
MSSVRLDTALGTPLGRLTHGPSGVQSAVRRPLPAARSRSFLAPRAVVLARASTRTNELLARALRRRGYRTVIGPAPTAMHTGDGDVFVGRLDVLETLDGVEPGLGSLARAERAGAMVVNKALALLSAHDKLLTAYALAREGIRHPATIHVTGVHVPLSLEPPYVVKPRFGSWGRDVVLCDSPGALRRELGRLQRRSWFRRHGAIVQEFVSGQRRDLRLVVAGGCVVGAVERIAPAGEWRTNVALGAVRRPVVPPAEARATAVRAAAALRIDLAGVDVMLDAHGQYVVLEVNGAVDFTSDYDLTGDVFNVAVNALVPSPREVIQSAWLAPGGNGSARGHAVGVENRVEIA